MFCSALRLSRPLQQTLLPHLHSEKRLAHHHHHHLLHNQLNSKSNPCLHRLQVQARLPLSLAITITTILTSNYRLSQLSLHDRS
ncbi:hypothetical protein P389DRAFT_94620 [Cystobasidium minutum MCA 4210]|uniref:uncharacterized protein n=1 Tax=Cystobasidium minutum MCA 4210 TaxID=1397322 RepID=UPI0034CDD338|eukprot:jgi/Rhomi1/94620/CE94619_72